MAKLRGIEADQCWRHTELDAVAAKVRVQLGIKPDQPIDGEHLFENLHRLGFGRNRLPIFQEVEPLPQGIEASSKYDADRDGIQIFLSPKCYADLEDGVARAKFTIAHEVGHAILHVSELKRLARLHPMAAALNRGAQRTHPPYKDTEVHANSFAAGLLIPAAEAAVEMKKGNLFAASRLRKKFGTSADVARIRVETVGEYFRHLLK